MLRFPVFLSIVILIMTSCESGKTREEISLNGTWDLARTGIDQAAIPGEFPSKIPVPGLVDMASPDIRGTDSAFHHSVFWYKTSFTADDSKFSLVNLKINKAAYHTRVFVNGKFAGENTRCYTPSVIDLKPFLNKNSRNNELVVSVGCRDQLPDTVVNGHDFEKIIYQPGIYDDVTLILGNYPFIKRIQVAPDIRNEQIRVTGIIYTKATKGSFPLTWKIRELASDSIVSSGKTLLANDESNEVAKIDMIIRIPKCHMWTPEDPFLYSLELSTPADMKSTRFGMRTFSLDRKTGMAILNGKPYYMRGTNVCIYRFFEDPSRQNLPWDPAWPVTLHKRFKELNWNSIRYCIGFPPERWYEIADSLGFLIQDEFPVWTGGPGGFEKFQKGLTADHLAREYEDWMRERWNHPCVVIWDAQNESVTNQTALAINKVRDLDLSGRPWDNGWAAPAGPDDAAESHPYLFSGYQWKSDPPGEFGVLYDLLSTERTPGNGPSNHSPQTDGLGYDNAIIINEYGWLWLNRNGTPTTLTDHIYPKIFPEAKTTEERFETYAYNLGVLTEYWRSSRKSAAVMHFCGLGYSRPDEPRGQTSDNFIDIQNLVYEPHFLKYMKWAFNPVGIMQDFWKDHFSPGDSLNIPVRVINDRGEPWEGKIVFSLLKDNNVIISKEVPASVEGSGEGVFMLEIVMPPEKGKYQSVASLNDRGQKISSLRHFRVK